MIYLAACSWTGGWWDSWGEIVELPSYMLVSDEFATRVADAPDIVYYTCDQKALTDKLNTYGLKFPDNIYFAEESLFVIVITDNLQEAFESLSIDPAERMLLINLKVDSDSDSTPPKKMESGRKNSRILVISCPPLKDIKSTVIKKANGVRHNVKREELKLSDEVHRFQPASGL